MVGSIPTLSANLEQRMSRVLSKITDAPTYDDTRRTGLFISKSTGAVWLINDSGTATCVHAGGYWEVGDRYLDDGDIKVYIPGVLLPFEGSVTLTQEK